jgi:uncharacterized protein YwgA
MPQRTDQQIVDAVTEARGMVSVAARKLGISRRTIYNRMKSSGEIAAAVEDSREFTTDVAELKLFQAIEKGEAWAVCFYLKCQGQSRGYIERHKHELTGSDGGPVMLKVIKGIDEGQV